MECKNLTVELKADQPGALVAVFSKLNVIDHDGDVTLPGAFTNGEEVRLLPSHDWSHYMLGKGVIKATKDRALFDGQFNLNTDAGRNWYESLKFDAANGKSLQEFSYGFDVLDAGFGQFEGHDVRFLKKLKVHEVSPVTLGAGIGTETVSIKALKSGNPPLAELLEYFSANPDKAAAYLESVKTAPPAPDALPDSLTPEEQELATKADQLLADVPAFAAQAALLKEGRTFSASNMTKLSTLATEIEATAGKLREMLTPAEPKTARSELDLMFERHQRLVGLYRELPRVPA